MAKILFITHSPLPDNRIDREAKSLTKNGHDVFIIYPVVRGEVPKHYKKSFHLPITNRVISLLPLASRQYAKKVKDVVKEVKPDVIHAHDIVAANITRLILNDEKFVYDDHEVWEIYLRNRFKEAKGIVNKLKKWLFYIREKQVFPKVRKNLDLLIVINDFWQSYYKKRNVKIDILTLENFASKELIDYVLKDKISVDGFFVEDKRNKIIHTTNMKISSDVRLRNVVNIAEAVNELPNWVLVVFGPEDEKYKNQSVKFLPRKPLDEFLASCSKCVLGTNLIATSNDWYNYISSNRVFELTALGLNVISTRVRTLIDKFGDNLIWVDENVSKEEIIKILKEIDKYPLKEKMREISKNFFWEIQEKNLIEAYDKL